MNRTGLLIALLVAAVVGIVFALWPELDLKIASFFYDPANGRWSARHETRVLTRLRHMSTWLIGLIAGRRKPCSDPLGFIRDATEDPRR